MAIHNVLEVLDAEISRLQQARSLIVADSSAVLPTTVPTPVPVLHKKRGPKPKALKESKQPEKESKRSLSVEARKKISDAVKARWATAKRDARTKKSAAAKKQSNAIAEA